MLTTAKIKTGTPLEAARAEVMRLARAEIEMQSELADVLQLLGVARPKVAAEYAHAFLDGEDVPPPRDADDVFHLQQRADMMSAAVDVLRAKRRDAIAASFKADAAERRAEAARLKREAGEREAVTTDLLAQLEMVEGCVYVPYWVPPGFASDDPPRVPLTTQQRQRADELDREAVRLENAEPVRVSGQLEAATADELVGQVTADPFMLAPREDHIREWCAAAAKEATPRQSGDAAWRVAFLLQWKDSEIVSGRSRAIVTRR